MHLKTCGSEVLESVMTYCTGRITYSAGSKSVGAYAALIMAQRCCVIGSNVLGESIGAGPDRSFTDAAPEEVPSTDAAVFPLVELPAPLTVLARLAVCWPPL